MAATFAGIKVTGTIRLNTGSVPTPTDLYPQYTVLRLPGTGTNNTANNTFIDSSSNNFTVTRFGNTTQGSFSPFSTGAGYWSNYFDGNGDSLSLSNNTAFDFGTGAFTVEFWMNPVSTTANGGIIIDTRLTSGWVIHTNPDNTMRLTVTLGAIGITSANTFNPQQWNHVALVRSGNTFRFYINGVSTNSSTITNSMTSNTVSIGIKSLSGSGVDAFNGYISNLRMVKGTALYTSDFTPSTTPLTAVSGTSLLTCQSNRFIDNSTNNFTITRNGDTSVSSFGPFVPASTYNSSTMGGSMYFDGTNDYLSTSTATVAASGNFTIEGWVNASVIGARRDFFSQSNPSADVAGRLFIYINASGSFEAFVGATPSNVLITHTSTVTTNQWYHFAFVRDSNVFKFYINGVVAATQPTSSISIVNFPTMIGTKPLNPTYWNGYISNIRVTSSAVYTANFTPPTAPVSAISGTSLLLNGTNGAIVDQSTKNNLETLGDAKVSTTVSANGSMYFDGTGDYLSAPASNLFNFGTGDFTIETWAYLNSGASATIIDTRNSDTLGAYIFNTDSLSKLDFLFRGSAPTRVTSSASVPTNQWAHFAVSRSAGTIRLFINGVQDGSVSFSGAINALSFPSIGGGRAGSTNTINGYFLNGYINDLRITNGIARYTANFTPPTRS